MLKKVARNEEWENGMRDPKDFARIFILFVFSCVLFPTSHLFVPAHLMHYVDDLETIGDYAWGNAVYEFLVDSMVMCTKGKRYIDGCTIGVLVRI